MDSNMQQNFFMKFSVMVHLALFRDEMLDDFSENEEADVEAGNLAAPLDEPPARVEKTAAELIDLLCRSGNAFASESGELPVVPVMVRFVKRIVENGSPHFTPEEQHEALALTLGVIRHSFALKLFYEGFGGPHVRKLVNEQKKMPDTWQILLSVLDLDYAVPKCLVAAILQFLAPYHCLSEEKEAFWDVYAPKLIGSIPSVTLEKVTSAFAARPDLRDALLNPRTESLDNIPKTTVDAFFEGLVTSIQRQLIILTDDDDQNLLLKASRTPGLVRALADLTLGVTWKQYKPESQIPSRAAECFYCLTRPPRDSIRFEKDYAMRLHALFDQMPDLVNRMMQFVVERMASRMSTTLAKEFDAYLAANKKVYEGGDPKQLNKLRKIHVVSWKSVLANWLRAIVFIASSDYDEKVWNVEIAGKPFDILTFVDSLIVSCKDLEEHKCKDPDCINTTLLEQEVMLARRWEGGKDRPVALVPSPLDSLLILIKIADEKGLIKERNEKFPQKKPLALPKNQILARAVIGFLGVHNKGLGNHNYSEVRDYAAAVEMYSLAIELSPLDATDLPIFYGNRCAAWLALKFGDLALRDAEIALSFDPKNAKAQLRRASALQMEAEQRDGASDRIRSMSAAYQVKKPNTETKKPEAKGAKKPTAPASSKVRLSIHNRNTWLAQAAKMSASARQAAFVDFFAHLDEESPEDVIDLLKMLVAVNLGKKYDVASWLDRSAVRGIINLIDSENQPARWKDQVTSHALLTFTSVLDYLRMNKRATDANRIASLIEEAAPTQMPKLRKALLDESAPFTQLASLNFASRMLFFYPMSINEQQWWSSLKDSMATAACSFNTEKFLAAIRPDTCNIDLLNWDPEKDPLKPENAAHLRATIEHTLIGSTASYFAVLNRQILIAITRGDHSEIFRAISSVDVLHRLVEFASRDVRTDFVWSTGGKQAAQLLAAILCHNTLDADSVSAFESRLDFIFASIPDFALQISKGLRACLSPDMSTSAFGKEVKKAFDASPLPLMMGMSPTSQLHQIWSESLNRAKHLASCVLFIARSKKWCHSLLGSDCVPAIYEAAATSFSNRYRPGGHEYKILDPTFLKTLETVNAMAEIETTEVDGGKTAWVCPGMCFSAATALAALYCNTDLKNQKEFPIPRKPMDWFVTAMKDIGNAQFQAGNFEAAQWLYGFAIDLWGVFRQPEGAILFSNRAQTFLNQERFEWAIQDAEAALKLDPSHAKSQIRLKLAKEMLERRNCVPKAEVRDKPAPGKQSEASQRNKKKKAKKPASTLAAAPAHELEEEPVPDHVVTCVICFERPINHALLPCGHTFCGTCVQLLKEECAICRQKFTTTLKLFF